VTGKRVDSKAGRSLVAAWDQSGHSIANHSYSHLFFNDANIGLAKFESDILKIVNFAIRARMIFTKTPKWTR
jgi:hypothetical protein